MESTAQSMGRPVSLKTEAESVPDENNINNTHLHKYKVHGQSRAHFTPEGNVIVGTLQEK